MRQVTQKLRDGVIEVVDVPRPVTTPEGVLVQVQASLLSAGTERSTVSAARSGLIGKARARPDQARQVVEKARREGLRPTLEAVRSRLAQPSPLGYSSAGVVLEVGSRVRDVRPGHRVACGGGGHAVHAEIDLVPGNLCVPVPDSVSFESAAFATVASIAMHGVRQAEARLGERVAVIGLGLVGQLAVRLLLAAGCQVVGIDLDQQLVSRAQAAGATAFIRAEIDPAAPPDAASECDAVVITAATSSEDPVSLAGALARDRGRVVVVGDVGMDLPRTAYYGKELELRLSRSYGPGRYDREYEERGLDYPVGYVRWTERRNMSSFIALTAAGRLSVEELITTRVPVEQAPEAYERLLAGSPSPLGIILTYSPVGLDGGNGATASRAPGRQGGGALSGAASTERQRAVGVIGAGSFARRLLIPGLREAGFQLSLVASGSGLSARAAADQFGFGTAVTPEELLESEDIGVVVVASRHGSHADYAVRALEMDKAAFVEKPPALTTEQLEGLRDAAKGRILQVGFNRRFAPLAQTMREHLSGAGPIELLYRIAAGRLPADHWLNDPEDGGGRLLGEGCHFVDFACWLVGALPTGITARVSSGEEALVAAPRFSVALAFPNGSMATIVYGSEAASSVGKELVEAHAAGRSAVIDDFRSLQLHGAGRPRSVRGRGQDKGHAAQFVAFRRLIEGQRLDGPDPLETMAVTFRALASAATAE